MKITLASGFQMPMIAFGTSRIPKPDVKQTVVSAIQNKFTHIDCAAIYQNEAEVGEGLSEALTTGLITRADLFLTTKVWPSDYRRIRYACLASLKRLQVDYMDLYLLHWPFTLKEQDSDNPVLPKQSIQVDRYPLHLAWAQMEALVEEGLVRSIGVSNWNAALLNDLLGYAKIPPVVNQIEINPYCKRKELVAFCQQNNVVPVGYRVIFRVSEAAPSKFDKCILDDSRIIAIAEKYSRSPAQVVLQWCLSRNCAVIVRTVNPAKMVDNVQSQDFKLTEEDIDAINSIPDEGFTMNPYPLFDIPIFS